MTEQLPIREGAFVEGPEGPVLVGNKCVACGQIFFPKVHYCLSCFEENLEDLKLSRQGELYSYAVGHMPSMHFQPPYAIGYVNLPEGIRLFTPLKMQEDKPFKVGMTMELAIEPLWEENGKTIVGYVFYPV
jgi:uncharacterized OB-fold protein